MRTYVWRWAVKLALVAVWAVAMTVAFPSDKAVRIVLSFLGGVIVGLL